jgi:hypothetical protein
LNWQQLKKLFKNLLSVCSKSSMENATDYKYSSAICHTRLVNNSLVTDYDIEILPKDSEWVQPITRLFIELAAVELLSDKPNLDQKVLILADEFVNSFFTHFFTPIFVSLI